MTPQIFKIAAWAMIAFLISALLSSIIFVLYWEAYPINALPILLGLAVIMGVTMVLSSLACYGYWTLFGRLPGRIAYLVTIPFAWVIMIGMALEITNPDIYSIIPHLYQSTLIWLIGYVCLGIVLVLWGFATTHFSELDQPPNDVSGFFGGILLMVAGGIYIGLNLLTIGVDGMYAQPDFLIVLQIAPVIPLIFGVSLTVRMLFSIS